MTTPKVILLVEDNASDEELARLAFQRCSVPCVIVVARDGAEALDYVFSTGKFQGRDSQAEPAMVVVDLKLPRVSGLDVLRRIRGAAETRLLPVIVLTASGQDEDLIEAYSLGANAYLRKPVDFAQFTETTRALGTFWLRHNVPPPRLR